MVYFGAFFQIQNKLKYNYCEFIIGANSNRVVNDPFSTPLLLSTHLILLFSTILSNAYTSAHIYSRVDTSKFDMEKMK